jgi:hypothetical protein
VVIVVQQMSSIVNVSQNDCFKKGKRSKCSQHTHTNVRSTSSNIVHDITGVSTKVLRFS